jgi:LacI family transcriptional regulator
MKSSKAVLGSGGVTIHKVAKTAGVSISTVSRVVNDLGRVAPDTRRKVEVAVKNLGFHPNSRARALSRKKTDTIGLLVPDFHGQYFSLLMEGAHEEAQRNGVHIMVLKAKSPEEKIESIKRLCQGGRADGVIIMLSELYAKVLEALDGIDTPLVVLDKDVKRWRFDNILLDNQLGGYEAARHFIKVHNADGIVFVGGSENNVDTMARDQGVSEAITFSGSDIQSEKFFCRTYSYEEGYRLGQEKIPNIIKPGCKYGVVAANDDIACGIIDSLMDKGISVPEQVGVMGFDDSYIAKHRRLKITTMRVPTKEIGRAAVRTIIGRLKGDDSEPAKVVLKAKLIVRESCGCNQKD